MLRMITLNDFEVVYQEFEINKDYNLRIKFQPKDTLSEVFGARIQYILYPHTFGLADTTITSENYNCVVLFDDSVISTSSIEPQYFAFLTKKVSISPETTAPAETAKVSQDFNERMGGSFRALKGPEGTSGLNLGNSVAEMFAGNNKILIGDSGISMYGSITEYSIPMKSCGGVFQETGILQLIPAVPPFGHINHMPDMSFVLKMASIMQVLKQLSEV